MGWFNHRAKPIQPSPTEKKFSSDPYEGYLTHQILRKYFPNTDSLTDKLLTGQLPQLPPYDFHDKESVRRLISLKDAEQQKQLAELLAETEHQKLGRAIFGRLDQNSPEVHLGQILPTEMPNEVLILFNNGTIILIQSQEREEYSETFANAYGSNPVPMKVYAESPEAFIDQLRNQFFPRVKIVADSTTSYEDSNLCLVQLGKSIQFAKEKKLQITLFQRYIREKAIVILSKSLELE